MIHLIALYIIGGILLFFAFIASLRAEVLIAYSDDLALTIRVLGIPIKILPKKKKKVKISAYSRKNRAKYEAAEKEKALKKAKKKKDKKKKKEEAKAKKKADKAAGKAKPKKPIGDIIDMIRDLVAVAVLRFSKHLRIRVARLHIGVATGDAASTAILYGAIAPAVACIAAYLDSTSTLRHPARSDVDIHADYLSEKMQIDIEIGFSICVWQVFDILFRTGFRLVKHL
ncbi:MAG: hypothetical protein J6S71_09880 [Clostridia bacterium]|nr:hypothetical protein [Clostridia bacterium]